MPNSPKYYINPNFNPRNSVLPEIPEEIKEYQLKAKKRNRIILFFLAILAILIIIGVIVWNFRTVFQKYQYVKIVSNYAINSSDSSPGPDIESIEIKIKNLTYYGEKVVATSPNFNSQKNNKYTDTNKVLGEANYKTPNDYVSLGLQNNYIIIKIKPDLQDTNVDQLIIHETSSNNLVKENYSIFIGPAKNGPWNYLGQYAGTAEINVKQYIKK